MFNILSTIAAFIVLGGATWFAYQLDPHWVSKDGERCVCKGRFQRDEHSTPGRWREVRVALNTDATITVAPKGLRGRRLTRTWTVTGSEETTRRQVFYLSGDGMAMIRLPKKSPFNAKLKAMMR